MVYTYMGKKLWLRVGLMGIVLAMIVFSIIRALYQIEAKNPLSDLIGQTIEVTGVIEGDPDISGETSSARLCSLIYNGDTISGTIYLYGYFDPEPERGDKVTIRGKLAQGFGTFVGAFYRPKIITLLKPEPKSITLGLRNSFATSVRGTIGGREAKLGLAYLLGMRNGLDDETLGMLSLIGLTHIVVASGTHLGIIVDFFRKKFGKISRFAGLLFGAVCVLLFGQIVGWTASITRAAIVSGLMMIGWYYGRKLNAGRVILIAIAITLTINPMYIVDIGWLLSFAAFIGIMVLEPMLEEFFYGRIDAKHKTAKRPGIIAQLVMASVTATLMCVPILLYYFGSISVISIVANVLILPTIPFAMGMTALTGLIGFLPSFFLLDWMRYIVIKVTTLILDYHLFVMEIFARQTNLIITMDKYNPLVFLLYIPILTLFAIGLIKRQLLRRKAKLRVYSDPEKYLPYTV